MRALALCLLLGASAAQAQGYSVPPACGMGALNPDCTLKVLNGVSNIWRVMGVTVAIPAIAPNSEATVSVAMPLMLPGDNAIITLAAGSTAPPAMVSPTVIFCTTAGTALIKYVNTAGGLTTNSATATITANFTLIR